jgi:hypothetical protein
MMSWRTSSSPEESNSKQEFNKSKDTKVQTEKLLLKTLYLEINNTSNTKHSSKNTMLPPEPLMMYHFQLSIQKGSRSPFNFK